MASNEHLSDQPEDLSRPIEFCQGLIDVALNMIGCVALTVDQNWGQDPRVVAHTLVSRCISNFRACILLIQHDQKIEGRAIVRLMYENYLWLVGIRDEGSRFVQKMQEDEVFNRNSLGELTLKIAGSGASSPQNANDVVALRAALRRMKERFPTRARLNANHSQFDAETEQMYHQYMQLSLDAVHCSVTALGRHLVLESDGEQFNRTVTIIPKVSKHLTITTIFLACNALIGCCNVFVEILEDPNIGENLRKIMDTLTAETWISELNVRNA